jgi:hypothetical protein
MQQQLFHSLRNAKQLNIRNLTKVNGIHETKLEKIYETKRKFTFHENKLNETKFRCFCVSRNKRNFAKQLFCFAFFRFSRNKKNYAKWKPYFFPWFFGIFAVAVAVPKEHQHFIYELGLTERFRIQVD